MVMQMRWIYEWNQTCCEWENLNKMGWMHELFKVNMLWNERIKKVTTHQVLSPWARLSHLSWSYLPWLTWWNFVSNAASIFVTWDVIWILVTSTIFSNPRFYNVFLLFLWKRARRSKTSHSLPCIRYKSRQNKGNPAWGGVNGYLNHINKYMFINIPFNCLATFPGNGARNACWYLLTWHL
jgi:hypothetical protein